MSIKVWIDALTPKHALLAWAFAAEFRRRGWSCVVTARRYDFTLDVMKRLGLDYVVVGGYGFSLKEKLVEDSHRVVSLADIAESADILVAYPNPSAARAAFGLGKPYVCISDSPHSRPASMLSIPLASTLVHSAFIPSPLFEPYLSDSTRVVSYYGVDELAWVSTLKPRKEELDNLGLREYEYVVLRPPERRAAYYAGLPVPDARSLAKALAKYATVVVVPRYPDDYSLFQGIENVIVAERGADGFSLAYWALAVVTGGGTMAREAALLGTPGLTLFPGKLVVDDELIKLGFPIYRVHSIDEVVNIVKNAANLVDELKKRAAELREQLVPPQSIVADEVERLCT